MFRYRGLYQRLRSNIDDLAGGELEDLDLSVDGWMMGGYWDVLVDLFTVEEGPSDLVLSLRVYPTEGSYTFRIEWLHVP